MVYLHFPSNLTEEELGLQAKYQKLKRKKKALQSLKTPKPEPEKATILPKRPAEGRDAKEIAKKLVKSGAIVTSKAPKRTEQSGFKRPMGLERKLAGVERTVSGYQPFSATQPEEVPEVETRPKVKNLYDSFVTARDREERGIIEKPREKGTGTTPIVTEKPRQGNTIFVSGFKITEEVLRNAFTDKGNIINISMEIEKNRGFVTFDKMEAAERAISEMHGVVVTGVQLKVSLARRQPVIEAINDASSSSTWSTIAASHSQKGSFKDKRDIITYEEEMFN